MEVTRLDLDGTGSPTGLVAKILKAEPNLKVPVPIEELAFQLDIESIEELETENFEGGLITDANHTTGGILVRKNVDRRRRRYTIGHELGHFLMPFHQPVKPGQFLCSREDMRHWDIAEQDRYRRMEVQANQFASLILMPPPKVRVHIGAAKHPDISMVGEISENFDVSKEAAARTYAEYQGEKLAVVVIKDSKVLRIYPHRTFPRLLNVWGRVVPSGSAYHRLRGPSGTMSQLSWANAAEWLETSWGVESPKLYEQVLLQKNDFAMILLLAETRDEDEDVDSDGERTARDRLRVRQSEDWPPRR